METFGWICEIDEDDNISLIRRDMSSLNTSNRLCENSYLKSVRILASRVIISFKRIYQKVKVSSIRTPVLIQGRLERTEINLMHFKVVPAMHTGQVHKKIQNPFQKAQSLRNCHVWRVVASVILHK